jgi:hypothetical protein
MNPRGHRPVKAVILFWSAFDSAAGRSGVMTQQYVSALRFEITFGGNTEI